MNLNVEILDSLKIRQSEINENTSKVGLFAQEKCSTSFYEPVIKELTTIANSNASLKSKLRKIQIITSSIREPLSDILPCRKGCANCCHIPVEITDTEAEIIGNAIGIAPQKLPRGLHKLDPTQHSRPDTPCPFLRQEECSIHENRPIVCRNHAILDVDNITCSFENIQFQATKDARAVGTPILHDAIIPIYLSLISARKNAVADIRHFFPIK